MILYNVTDDRVPFTRDYVEVFNITDVYLRDYFTDLFSSVNFATLDFFESFFLHLVFRQGQPIEMEYESAAFFDEESSNIPSSTDLDFLLSQAFLDQNMANYTRLLQGLNKTNPFSTTTSVTQTFSNSSQNFPDTESKNTKLIIGTTLASAAAVGALFAIGIFVRNGRRKREDKSLVHGHFSFGADDTLITEDETMALSTNPIFLAPSTLSPVQNVSYINEDYESLAESATSTSGGEPKHHSRTQSFGSASSFDTMETDFLREYANESVRAVNVEPNEENTSSVSESDEEASEGSEKADEPQKEEATSEGSGKAVESPQEETASVGSNKAKESGQEDAASIDQGNVEDTEHAASSTPGVEDNLLDRISGDEQKSTISEETDVPESYGEANGNSSGDDTVPLKNTSF
jgi:hypothetical protein